MSAIRALAVCLVLAVSAVAPSAAQPQGGAYRGPDLAAQRAAIARLAPLVGEWRGEAQVAFPGPMTVFQHERVETDLDGLVLVVHGAGYGDAAYGGEPIFQAMAVISYNDQSGVYEFRAYNEGRAVTAEAQFLEDGSLRWSMSPPGVQIRYTISFDQTSWREIGEMSRDGGQTWTRTIEMNLNRVS